MLNFNIKIKLHTYLALIVQLQFVARLYVKNKTKQNKTKQNKKQKTKQNKNFSRRLLYICNCWYQKGLQISF